MGETFGQKAKKPNNLSGLHFPLADTLSATYSEDEEIVGPRDQIDRTLATVPSSTFLAMASDAKAWFAPSLKLSTAGETEPVRPLHSSPGPSED